MQFFIILLILLLIILSVCIYAYLMAFRAPKRTDFTKYTLPEGEQYFVYHAEMKKAVEEVLSVPYEEVYISSFDNVRLYARYYHVKDNAPVHILFHGYKSNPYIDFCGGNKLARDLGHNVLSIDERSHGKSSGHNITFGIKERQDCLHWIHYCLERFGDDVPIILCGLSMGAATVLMALDLDLPKNVVGIIADCPFASPKAIIQKVSSDMHFPAKLIYPFIRLSAFLFGGFNLEESSAVAAVKNSRVPILLFHGDDDRFVPCDMSRAIKAANPDAVSLEIFSGAGHGLCYMTEPARYRNTTIAFLRSVLPSDSI